MIKLANELSLPASVLTQTVSILARKRSGKSYTMRRFAEQLLKAKQQVVLVDPKGDQWGLRSSADGKRPGFPVIILGGEHGDVPLESSSGELVARLAVMEQANILIDLSLFRKHEVATFMTAFLENLYRLKAREEYRTPMMLVIDEADAIAPQKPQKGEERMLGAAEDIVRRGGQRGIGCCLVTQRSAVLNKNVLTQTQILVCLRTIAPQDLDAMDAWITQHGTDEQKAILMTSLPSLPVGDAWFWSPGWPTTEGIFKRVHILPIETFDSGATPEAGQKRIRPKNLADIDKSLLERQMAETVQKAKENDPKELQKTIRALQVQVAKLESRPVHAPVDKKEATQKSVIALRVQFVREHNRIMASHEKRANAVVKEHFDAVLTKINMLAIELRRFGFPPIPAPETLQLVAAPPVPIPPPAPANTTRHNRPPVTQVGDAIHDIRSGEDGERKLIKAEREILSYLASNPDRHWSTVQISAMTGYAPTGGGFQNAYRYLKFKGYATTDGSGRLKFSYTPEKLNIDKGFSLDSIKRKLLRAEREILQFLINNSDKEWSDEDIAANTKSENGTPYSVTGGGFMNALRRLNYIGFTVRENGRSRLHKDIEELVEA